MKIKLGGELKQWRDFPVGSIININLSENKMLYLVAQVGSEKVLIRLSDTMRPDAGKSAMTNSKGREVCHCRDLAKLILDNIE